MANTLYKSLLFASLTGSSVLSGCLFSLSYISVASILAPPDVPERLMLTQWRTVFNRGFHLCPPSAIFSGLCCFTNAYLTYRQEGLSSGLRLYGGRVASLLVAGSFMIGIVPYTLSLIVPLEVSLLAEEAKMRKMLQAGAEVNHGMNGKAEGGSSEENVTKTRSMIRRWAKLNYGRMILPLTGAVIVCIEYIRGE